MTFSARNPNDFVDAAATDLYINRPYPSADPLVALARIGDVCNDVDIRETWPDLTVELYRSAYRIAKYGFRLRKVPGGLDAVIIGLRTLQTHVEARLKYDNLLTNTEHWALAAVLALIRLDLGDRSALASARAYSADFTDTEAPGDAGLKIALGLMMLQDNDARLLYIGRKRDALAVHVRDIAIATADAAVKDWLTMPFSDVKFRPQTSSDRWLQDVLDDKPGIEKLDLDGIEHEVEDPVPVGHFIKVIPNLDHLPGQAATGRALSAGAMKEYGQFAQVPLPCAPVPNLPVMQALLLEEFPHLQQVVMAIVDGMRNVPYARTPNVLLEGPPGGGKSRLARRIFELSQLPWTLYSAAGVSDGSFGGTSRQWGSARVSVPVGLLTQHKSGAAGLIVDEVDKGGSDNRNGNLAETLLPFLEPETARNAQDPYLEAPCDTSGVSYLLTANDLGRVPQVLKDRVRVLHVPHPDLEHLPALARSMLSDIRTERGESDLMLPDLDQVELDAVAAAWAPRSMRALSKLVAGVLNARQMSMQ